MFCRLVVLQVVLLEVAAESSELFRCSVSRSIVAGCWRPVMMIY